MKNELNDKLKRKAILNAADNYLSDQDEGDNYDAYLELLKESEAGNDDCLAADYVNVWEPLEHTTVAGMIRLIEDSIVLPEMPDFMKKMDWAELRKQKASLLAVIEYLENNKLQTLADNLHSILNVIDALQDSAVDEYGTDENTVFELTKRNEE